MENGLLNHTFGLISDYLKRLDDSAVSESLMPEALAKKINFSLGESHPEQVLQKLMAQYLESSVKTQHPAFFNQLFSGFDSLAMQADFLSTLTNTTMVTYEVAPVATMMEMSLIKKMLSFTGWTNGDGIMTSGGSNVNMMAILMARNLGFKETKKAGNQGLPFVVFVSEESHYSFSKAMNQLGLGTENLQKIPSDEYGRMIPEKLDLALTSAKNKNQIPLMVAATSGTTVLGAFDSLEEISSVTKKHQVWLHVDGSWGGSFLLSPKHKHLLKGIEQADSLAWDPHKMLATGVVSSVFLTKHQGALLQSQGGGGEEYLFHHNDHEQYDLGAASLQCGRRVDAFKVWLMWKALGDVGMSRRVEELRKLTLFAKEEIKKRPMLELLYEPEGLNICFRYRYPQNPNEKNLKLREALLASGKTMVNFSSRHNVTFLRLVIANPKTTEKHLTQFIDLVCQTGERL
jgi:glutamate/tyrosine decarboxylase-like PLP-dependent enzyme